MFCCPICNKDFLDDDESMFLDPKNDEIAEHICKEHAPNLALEFVKWLVNIEDGLNRLDYIIGEMEDDMDLNKEEDHYCDLPSDFE